ncbi:MAG: SGNH/GDSL hydrolase family protein [Anaerolineae bacterium]
MTNTPKPSLKRRLLNLVGISGTTIFLTLFVIELVVRWVPLYPDIFTVYDPARGWRNIPNKSGIYLNVGCLGEYRTPVTINSQGLHDVEHSYDPSADTTRITLIGDSLVAAFEVPLEQSAHRQLESLLNAEGNGSYEVIGAGHQGYGTALELLFYEQEGRRYQSDIVLLVVEPANDLYDNHPELSAVGAVGYPYFTLDDSGELLFHAVEQEVSYDSFPGEHSVNPLHDALYHYSYLYRLLSRRYFWVNSVRQSTVSSDDYVYYEQAEEVTAALLARMRDEVTADGARFGVVIAPASPQRREALQATQEWLRGVLDEQGIPYLDLQPAFESDGRSLFFACDVYHWNADGQRFTAEQEAAFIRTLLNTP